METILMKLPFTSRKHAVWSLAIYGAFCLWAQSAETPPPPGDPLQPMANDGPFDGGPGFGPPPFDPGGFGPGGPGMRQPTKLVKQFDKDGDGRLNQEERKAAREFLAKQGTNRGPRGPGGRRGGPGGPGGFGGPGENQTPPQPGPKLAPADVKSFPDAPLYDIPTLRTYFLEFENADWEKELADFKNTDVEVSAKLTVDGKTYLDVGVRFRGNSSFMMVGEGYKRSLNVTLDFVHKDQHIGGCRTLNLLNSHEDPTFLHIILFSQVARDYIPAPKANYARVVINGESWGVYVNAEQVNKDFVKEWYGTAKGARWKVPGSPNGRGGLSYLGEDPAQYKRIYEIKSKDDPKSWAVFIHLCKVLNETPADKLQQALAPLLDIDGVLKFMALDNVVINGDGFWTRASDYYLYEDVKGCFHIIPNDVNETFSIGGPGGPGGPGGFGPGMFMAPQILTQADKNGDGKLGREEFTALADAWFDKLDPDKTEKVNQESFTAKLAELLPPPQGQPGFGPPGGGPPGGGPGGFGPMRFIGSSLFTALDANKDGSIARVELKDTFGKWFGEWDAEKSGVVNEEKLRTGLSAALPRPNFGGPGGGPGGPGGRRGPGGPGLGGGPRANGIELDPLVSANDQNKPLLSKLLAVPALRTRYLGYVRDMAEKWLDWNKLGPLAQQYQAVIAEDVKKDTRKLYSTEAFSKGVLGDAQTTGEGGRPQESSLKSFAEKRRAYLLSNAEVKKAAR